MKKGQITLTGFVISFVVLVLIIGMLPVIKVAIGVGSSGLDNSDPDYWVMWLIPVIMIIAGIVGFFVWNAVVVRQ